MQTFGSGLKHTLQHYSVCFHVYPPVIVSPGLIWLCHAMSVFAVQF